MHMPAAPQSGVVGTGSSIAAVRQFRAGPPGVRPHLAVLDRLVGGETAIFGLEATYRAAIERERRESTRSGSIGRRTPIAARSSPLDRTRNRTGGRPNRDGSGG
ncbi:hypothetical protein NJ7G_1184 [Natrinema sp. J7-2]|nr:hypothetical protein NJ7G_1184 [Natrinema sp. J7-2]